MYDCLIIGAGPAGITAGIYAKRFNLNVGIFENDAPGGAVTKTEMINNYPGFDGIAGYELASKMFNQAMNLDSVGIFSMFSFVPVAIITVLVSYLLSASIIK